MPSDHGAANAAINLPLDKFLQAESMVTPAALGLAVAGASAAFAGVLHMSDAGIVVLILSFVFGVVTVITTPSATRRTIFYVLNSILIFTSATGQTLVAKNLHAQADVSIVSTAFAQSPAPQTDQNSSSFIKPIFGLGADRSWTVIIGSYQNAQNASSRLGEIADNFPGKYNLSIQPSKTKPGWWALTAASGVTKDEAASIRLRAIEDGVAKDDAFIRRIQE